MAVYFPDIEPILVDHIRDSLALYGYDEVHVATKKAGPQVTPQPLQQVVVIASYGPTVDYVINNASAVIDIYATEYATASELAILTAAVVSELAGAVIKKATITLGPIRQSDEAPEEKRSMSVDLVVKGSTL